MGFLKHLLNRRKHEFSSVLREDDNGVKVSQTGENAESQQLGQEPSTQAEANLTLDAKAEQQPAKDAKPASANNQDSAIDTGAETGKNSNNGELFSAEFSSGSNLRTVEDAFNEALKGSDGRYASDEIERANDTFNILLDLVTDENGYPLKGIRKFEVIDSGPLDCGENGCDSIDEGRPSLRFIAGAVIGEPDTFVEQAKKGNVYEPFLRAIVEGKRQEALGKEQEGAEGQAIKSGRNRLEITLGLDNSRDNIPFDAYYDFSPAVKILAKQGLRRQERAEATLANIFTFAKGLSTRSEEIPQYKLDLMAIRLAKIFEAVSGNSEVPAEMLHFSKEELSLVAGLMGDHRRNSNLGRLRYIPYYLEDKVYAITDFSVGFVKKQQPSSSENSRRMKLVESSYAQKISFEEAREVLSNFCLSCQAEIMSLVPEWSVAQVESKVMHATYHIVRILSKLDGESLELIFDDPYLDPAIRGLALKVKEIDPKELKGKLSGIEKEVGNADDLMAAFAEESAIEKYLGSINLVPPKFVRLAPDRQLLREWYAGLVELTTLTEPDIKNRVIMSSEGLPLLPEWAVQHAVPFKKARNGELWLQLGDGEVSFSPASEEGGPTNIKVKSPYIKKAKTINLSTDDYSPEQLENILRAIMDARSLSSLLGVESDRDVFLEIKDVINGVVLEDDYDIAPWLRMVGKKVPDEELYKIVYALNEIADKYRIDNETGRKIIPFKVYRKFLERLGYEVTPVINSYGEDVSNKLEVSFTDVADLFRIPKKSNPSEVHPFDKYLYPGNMPLLQLRASEGENISGFGYVQKKGIKVTPKRGS